MLHLLNLLVNIAWGINTKLTPPDFAITLDILATAGFIWVIIFLIFSWHREHTGVYKQ